MPMARNSISEEYEVPSERTVFQAVEAPHGHQKIFSGNNNVLKNQFYLPLTSQLFTYLVKLKI